MEKSIYKLEVDNNYEWFINHKELIIKENPKKIGYFALLKNKKLIGLYENYQEAFIEANKKFNNEPYSIQILEKKQFINKLGYIGLKI